MRKFSILIIFAVFFFFSCGNPVLTPEPSASPSPTASASPEPTSSPSPEPSPSPSPSPTPEPTPTAPAEPVKTPTTIPDGYKDVCKAAFILRGATLSASIHSRGIFSRGDLADTDPLAQYCTEEGSVYFFKDDNSLTQYEAIDRDTYFTLKTRAAQSCEGQAIANPDKPWDYIAVDPPAPPAPVYAHDPVLAKWEICIADNADTGTKLQDWQLTSDAEYDNALTLVPAMLEQWNTLHPDNLGHLVYGGK